MELKKARDVLKEKLLREDLTIEEMVETSGELLELLAPKQTRYKVNERPDVRTIRYYTSQGLLPKPVSYQQGRARYSGAHLLRLLLIKKLQADHNSLSQIAQKLSSLDDSQTLQALLPAEVEQKTPAPLEVRAEEPDPDIVWGLAARRIRLASGTLLSVPEELVNREEARLELAQELERLALILREQK